MGSEQLKTDDIVAISIIACFIIMMTLEALFPARSYPQKYLWRLKGWGFFIVMFAISAVLPLAFPIKWVEDHRLINLSGLNLFTEIVIGYASVSLISYVWHRAAHRFNFMWRTFHQLHHAPQRMDMAGATIFHPFEIVVFITISTLITMLVLGLSPEAAAYTGLVAQFYSFFQHLNVKTPSWVGYLIQRPEAHFVHHQREIHAYNYGDLPIWDLLFGTFRNPKKYGEGEVGFPAPADSKLISMLKLKDVSESIGTQIQSQGQTK